MANSHDLRTDLKLDVSYDAVTKSLLEAMDIIRNDASFKPLQSYSRVVPADGSLPLDRYLFLMGTMHAAKNSEYNTNAELTDPVRGPYYSGEKNIYNISQVSGDFDIGFATDYLVVFLAGIALIFDLVTIILNCIARMFNMLFLYIIAPPIFATQPLDGGGKTKQWMTAFIVQAFSVFGTVIAMRLLLILLPIVTSSKLVLFENSMLNVMAKLVLMYGLFEVAKKATGLLTGILADSAGWQSVQAGDMSGSAGKLIGGVTGAAKAVGGAALKATGKVADVATKPLQNVAKRGYDATIGKAANAWNNLGKGDVEGQKAMTAAKERLATEQAYAKLTGGQGPGSGSGSGSGGDGEDSGGAASKTLETGSKVAGTAASALTSMAGGTPGSSGSGGPGSSGSSGSGSGSGGDSGSSGSGSGSSTSGKGAAKSPPPLPGKQGGGAGGAKKPLSPQAQKLFGTDANGKATSGGGAGGKSAVAAGAAKAVGGVADAAKSTVAAAGKAVGGAAKSVGSGVSSAASGEGQPLSVKAQNLFGTDANGQVRSKEAPAPGSRPTMDSFESRQSAPTQSTQQSAPSNNVSGSGGQKPLSQAAQNLFGVDASGRTRTPPPQTRQSAPAQPARQSAPAQPARQNAPAQPARQSASTQPTRQRAPAPSAPSPRQGGGLPNNQNGKK